MGLLPPFSHVKLTKREALRTIFALACRFVQQYNEKDPSTWRSWDLSRMTMQVSHADYESCWLTS